jgi:tetratricopeptide (TPR) repeat protein
MRASAFILEREVAGLIRRKRVSCFLFGLLLLCCTCVFGKNPIENLHSDTAGPEQIFGAQLITANALRAPSKAQRALEKAAAAIVHNESREAEKQLARALELYPDYAKALTVRATLRMATERSEAIKDLQHAIQVDPQYGVPYAVLAGMYNDSERYDDALPLVQRALQLLPLAWPVHYEMARALCGKNRSIEALREVTEAEKRMSADKAAHPESVANVHYLRGTLLLVQHEFAEARREFQATLNTEPQGPLAAISNHKVALLEPADIR